MKNFSLWLSQSVLFLFLATIPALSQDFLNENFNVPAGQNLPNGWTKVNLAAPNTDWYISAPAPTKYPTITMLGSNFAFADADAGGSGSTTNVIMTSPAFNTAAANVLKLEFYQVYRDYTATPSDSGIVEIFNGVNWVAVQKKNTSTPNNGTGFEKVTLDISNLKNAQMRIRFRYVGLWPWFWGIDDLRIFQPVANDVGVTAILAPAGSCGLSANAQIKIQLSNFGSANQTSVPVRYKIGNNPTVSEIFTGSLAAGGTAEYTFTAPGNFSAPGDYFISAWTALTGDASINNDSTKNYKVTKGSANFGVVSYSGYTGTNLATIHPGWREGEGTMPFGVTSTFRPSEDVQTFAFNTRTAAVNMFTNSRKEWHVSPPIVPTDISGLLFRIAVTNWLTAEPDQMGSDDKFQVMVSTNCGVSWNPIRTFDRSSNIPNTLTNQTVSLVQYAGQEIQVAFYATDGTVDDPEDYDFHLDSIRINNLPPNELAIGNITSPVSGCSVASPQLKVIIYNLGTNSQTNFPVCATINNGTPVCQNFTGTLAAGAQAEFTFTNLPVLNTPGDYTIKVAVNLPNDYDPSNNTTPDYFFQNIPNVTTFPYAQSFETNNGGWIPGGTFPSWALGNPNKPIIKGAGAGNRAYVTGGLANGTYNINEKSFVLGPCMDFSSLPNPMFEMKAWWASEFSEDGAVLQATTNGGTTWITMGGLNQVSRWYNDNTVGGLSTFYPTGTNPNLVNGWTGGLNDDFGSKGWVTVKNDLKGLGGQSSVRLRIAFGSGADVVGDGFAFDDIRIYEKADRDLAIVSFERPRPSGCGMTDTSKIQIRVKNVGKQAVNNPSFGYRRLFPNGTPVTGTATATIDTNAFYTYTFTQNENLGNIATYDLQGWVSLTNDAHRSDDTVRRATFTKRGLFADTIKFQQFTGFNLPVMYSGWSSLDGNPLPVGQVTNWLGAYITQQQFYGKNVARIFMGGPNTASWILGPAYQIQNNAFLNFEVATTDGFDTTNHPGGGLNGTDDKLRVMVSTNCGDSWTEVFAVKSGDNVTRIFKRFKADLTAYAGKEIRVALWATTFPNNDPNQYDLLLDNIFMETLEPFDGGVTSFVAPLISCGLSDNIQVKVNVRNFGSQPISNFPIYYQINQSNPVNEIYTGTLAAGASAVYTFANPANLSLSQPYVITAGTNVANDNNTVNNIATIDLVKVLAPFSPTPLSGFDGANLSTIWKGWNEAKGTNPVEGPSSWVNASFAGQTVLKVNLAGNSKIDWLLSPGIKIGTNNFLKFNAGLFQQNGLGSAQFDVDDSVTVMVSTNCGSTWNKLFKLGPQTIPALTNNMQPYSVSLSAYNNQEIRLGFRARDGVRIDHVSDLYLSGVEIVSSLQIDASPFEINFAPSISFGGSFTHFVQDTTYTISTTVSNFGSQPISNIPVAVFFNSENLLLTDTVEQTITPGNSVNLILGTFTPTTLGMNFRAKLYTSMPGDEAVPNDTITFNYRVYPITSIENQLAGNAQPKLFPNPTSGQLTIQLPKGKQMEFFIIRDALGREIKPLSVSRFDEETILDISGYAAGLYLVEISYGGMVYREKVKME